MKTKYILTLSLICILVTSFSAVADTIQLDDTWQYEASNGVTYNENAFEIVNYNPEHRYEPIRLVKVDTDRQISYPTSYNYTDQFGTISGWNLTFSTSDTLYVTQEGGFPLLSNTNITGTITSKNNTLNVSNLDKPTIYLDNDISELFTTGDNVVEFNRFIEWELEPGIEFYIVETFEVFTNQPSSDTTRNYTYVRTDVATNYDMDSSQLDLSQDGDIIIELTWSQESKIPTYIKQKMGVNSGLQLLQESNFIEYFLIQNDTETEKTSFIWYLPLSTIVIISLLQKKKVIL